MLRQTTLPLNLGGQTIIEGPVFGAGYLDEVRIWNKARTHAEIAQDRFCRIIGPQQNLTGYWNFDDGTANDLSGNGNNGVFQGGASLALVRGPDMVHLGICGPPYFEAGSFFFRPGVGFQQAIVGPSGLDLKVEVSTNLLNWVPWFVLPNFSGRLDFIDAAAVDYQRRFYRAVGQ